MSRGCDFDVVDASAITPARLWGRYVGRGIPVKLRGLGGLGGFDRLAAPAFAPAVAAGLPRQCTFRGLQAMSHRRLGALCEESVRSCLRFPHFPDSGIWGENQVFLDIFVENSYQHFLKRHSHMRAQAKPPS